MTLEASVHAFRLRVIAPAQALGNVSQACREVGISRTLFYRWRWRSLACGPDGVYPRRHGPRRGRPSCLGAEAERTILALVLAWPTWGPVRLAAQLARPEHGSWRLAPATIYRFLRRVGPGTRWQRLAVLEVHSAQTAGLRTGRTRRALARAQRRRPPHLAAEQPGDLICLDTFYIGKLKGVGKVWQYTACDAACSYAIAAVATEFLGQGGAVPDRPGVARLPGGGAVGPPRAHRPGQRVPRGVRSGHCRPGIRHTRTRPRHAWTNGFVERLQGTIPSRLWRVELRRRFFTHGRFLQAALDRYLAFYNHRRPHLGYRTNGRPPAEIFWGVAWRGEHDYLTHA